MENLTRNRLARLASLTSLLAIPLLLWACGPEIATPTPTPTPPDALALATATMDPQQITLPTVEPTHPHDRVPTTCPAEINCMGHMYMARATVAEGFEALQGRRFEIYTVLHDHGNPDLTGATIALVDSQPVAAGTPTPAGRAVDVYLDPTWDFQLDPAELANTQPCNITNMAAAEAKLTRVIDDLVLRLEKLPEGVFDDKIWGRIDLGNPFGTPRPTIDIATVLPSFATSTPTTSEPLAPNRGGVRCIVVAEDRNDHHLILAVQGIGVAKGVELPGVVVETVTPAP